MLKVQRAGVSVLIEGVVQTGVVVTIPRAAVVYMKTLMRRVQSYEVLNDIGVLTEFRCSFYVSSTRGTVQGPLLENVVIWLAYAPVGVRSGGFRFRASRFEFAHEK